MDALILNGELAPDFSLPDLSAQVHVLSAARGKIVILNFWSAECPWAERADLGLVAALKRWGERVTLLTIASNSNETPEQMAQAAQERGLPVVLHDEDQKVADAYGAQTTPYLFVVDGEGKLRYQGAYDDVTFHQRTPTQNYLTEAVEALLKGQIPHLDMTPPYGCVLVR
ncbi:MAG: redoxin domain-containing protein [Chloroflexota bacterium]